MELLSYLLNPLSMVKVDRKKLLCDSIEMFNQEEDENLVNLVRRIPLRFNLPLPLGAPLVLQLVLPVVDLVASTDWDSIAGEGILHISIG